jgi:hypothetical protein
MSDIKPLITIFFALMILLGCEPAPEDLLVNHFVIEEGEHYASPRLAETLQSSRLVFEATFDATSWYVFEDRGLQDSKNKLLGFSDCNSAHHENSARFAWQWYDNRLEIYAYCYVNGERLEKFVGTVEQYETNRYEIEVRGDQYVFRLGNETQVVMPRGNTCDKGLYYMLWPYFGGTLPAPHDVHIAISIKR